VLLHDGNHAGLKLSDIRRYSQLTWKSFRCWQPC